MLAKPDPSIRAAPTAQVKRVEDINPPSAHSHQPAPNLYAVCPLDGSEDDSTGQLTKSPSHRHKNHTNSAEEPLFQLCLASALVAQGKNAKRVTDADSVASISLPVGWKLVERKAAKKGGGRVSMCAITKADSRIQLMVFRKDMQKPPANADVRAWTAEKLKHGKIGNQGVFKLRNQGRGKLGNMQSDLWESESANGQITHKTLLHVADNDTHVFALLGACLAENEKRWMPEIREAIASMRVNPLQK